MIRWKSLVKSPILQEDDEVFMGWEGEIYLPVYVDFLAKIFHAEAVFKSTSILVGQKSEGFFLMPKDQLDKYEFIDWTSASDSPSEADPYACWERKSVVDSYLLSLVDLGAVQDEWIREACGVLIDDPLVEEKK